DERYPHPPLMPIDPLSRAYLRQAMYRISRDWIEAAKIIETSTGKKRVATAKKLLREEIVASDDLFGLNTYLLSEELSLVDCALTPLLWRLPAYDVEIDPRKAPHINQYMEHMFARDSFKRSLTEAERVLREGE